MIDKAHLAELYREAVSIATEITADNPKLFKTTFQCVFWEACHYYFQKKLREEKK